MSVLRRMPKMRQTVAHRCRRGAGHAILGGFRRSAPERSQFVRLCYKSWQFVSSGRLDNNRRYALMKEDNQL
jgi:hypothetical protein